MPEGEYTSDELSDNANILNHRTTTVYDLNAALVDGSGTPPGFVYDTTGTRVQLIYPHGERTTFGYDSSGQQNLKIEARGNRTTYTFINVGPATDRKYTDVS